MEQQLSDELLSCEARPRRAPLDPLPRPVFDIIGTYVMVVMMLVMLAAMMAAAMMGLID